MTEKIRAICRSPNKRTKLIFVAGIIGILLILCSELIPQSSSDAGSEEENDQISFDETAAYKKNIEDQLADIISQIQGVGDVKVMITISGTKEYVYAEQSDVNQQTESGSGSLQQKNEIILADTKDEKKPVVRKIISPQIGGAVIVCEGASDPQTKERVINAVTAALGLTSGKISVEPMNK